MLPGVRGWDPGIDHLPPPAAIDILQHSLELLRPGFRQVEAVAKRLRVAQREGTQSPRWRIRRDLPVPQSQRAGLYRTIVSEGGLQWPQGMSYLTVDVVRLLGIKEANGCRIERPQ